MKDYEYRIVMRDMSQYNVVYLLPLSDTHIGCRDVDYKKLQGYIDWIKNHNNALTILNGDMMNCAWKDSTPELYDDLITLDDAYDKLKGLLHPIKNKIVMVTCGGHEESVRRKTSTDYMAHLVHDLRPTGVSDTDHDHDIPYKPNGGAFGILLGSGNHRALFKGYALHGWGGARTIGAKVKKARDLQAVVSNAHCYILSHDHTMNVNRGNPLEFPTSRLSQARPIYLQEGRKLFVNTGGFLKYSGYIQRKGYEPMDRGTLRIRVELRKSKAEDWHLDIHASM